MNLYWNQTAAIRIGNEISKEVPVQKGVRQGYILSPILFNVYTEEIFGEIAPERGISIGGTNINLKYADDTVLLLKILLKK